MSMMNLPEGFKPKSPWKKPEGMTGWLMLGGIGVALFYLWGKISTFVLSTITNTFWMIVYAIGVAFLVEIFTGVFGTTLHTTAKNIFWSLNRALTSIFVTIDPIGILKNALQEMKTQYAELIRMIERFSGTCEFLRKELQRLTNDFRTFGSQAQEAARQAQVEKDAIRKQKLHLAAETKYQNAQLAQQSVKETENLLREAEGMLNGFQTMANVAEAKVDRFTYKVDHLSRQRKVNQDAKKSLSIGRRLLRGNPEQEQMVDMAAEYLAEDAARTAGEMREMMRYTDKLHLEQQITSGAAVSSIAAELAAFNARLLTSTNELGMSDNEFHIPGTNMSVINVDNKHRGSSAASGSSVKDLFD